MVGHGAKSVGVKGTHVGRVLRETPGLGAYSKKIRDI